MLLLFGPLTFSPIFTPVNLVQGKSTNPPQLHVHLAGRTMAMTTNKYKENPTWQWDTYKKVRRMLEFKKAGKDMSQRACALRLWKVSHLFAPLVLQYFLKFFFSLFSWTKFLLESSKGNIEGKGPGYLLIIWLKSAGRLIPHHRTGAPLRFWANEQKRLYPWPTSHYLKLGKIMRIY